jgi:pheophorbide a oxygenase
MRVIPRPRPHLSPISKRETAKQANNSTMKIPFALLAASTIHTQQQLGGGDVVLAFSSSLAPLVTKKTTFNTAATELQSTTSLEEPLTSEASSTSNKIRPLHQNWFPVSITTALKLDRPNAIELLSQKLVLYQDNGSWTCLADRCSHRFAPLSEGRLISRSGDSSDTVNKEASTASSSCTSCSIQCAYHGWQFDSTGKCTTVPQNPSSSDKAQSVPKYPCREESGMVWVWADADSTTWDMAKSIPLPISPLVRRAYENYGADACFMRDLPYGMELLGENLLDLSHLPFSHHSVGGLDRNFGGELPLRMMSEQERITYAQWEEEFLDKDQKEEYAVPLHQAEVMNANDTDPIFIAIANRFPSGVSENANATISFYEPCHVRYRRERLPGTFGHVELFMSPTSAGKSRVFLWNTIYKPEEPVAAKTLKTRLAKLSPLAAIKKALLAKLMNPATSRAHSVAHLIFDGDGIFLNYQGNRMHESGLTFRDYSTPSSSDILLNSYRRYLDSAAKLSTKAAAKTVSYQSGDAYAGGILRSEMLDRYNSHTKNCKVCLQEMERNEKQRGLVNICKTALVGAGGASTAALIATLLPGKVLSKAIARAAAMSILASFLGYTGLSKKEAKLDPRYSRSNSKIMSTLKRIKSQYQLYRSPITINEALLYQVISSPLSK